MSEDVEAYSVGGVHASVCSALPLDETTAILNQRYPTGIASRWQPSDEPTFAGGQPNPCPCERDPARRHYLFAC